MRISMPVENKSLDAGICPSFGRAPYFLFYNTDTKEAEFLVNDAAASQGGAGISAAQTIADHHTDALLTPRCGENAAKVLNKAEIPVYKTINGTAKQNIDAFAAKQLILLQEFHPGFHGHEK